MPCRSRNAPPRTRTPGARARPGARRYPAPRHRCPAAWRAAARAISDDVEAVSVSSPSNDVGQPEGLSQPPDDDLLELGAARRRPPQHRVLVDRRRQHLGEDPGSRGGRGEVGEEAGMLPGGRIRLDEGEVVAEDRLEALGSLRRLGRQRPLHRSGLDCRQDVAPLDIDQIVGHEVDDAMGRRPGTSPGCMSASPAICSGSRSVASAGIERSVVIAQSLAGQDMKRPRDSEGGRGASFPRKGLSRSGRRSPVHHGIRAARRFGSL